MTKSSPIPGLWTASAIGADRMVIDLPVVRQQDLDRITLPERPPGSYLSTYGTLRPAKHSFNAVRALGYYIRREMRYDFPLDIDWDDGSQALVAADSTWHGDTNVYIVHGIVAVKNCTHGPDCAEVCRELLWAWTHPYDRNHGIATALLRYWVDTLDGKPWWLHPMVSKGGLAIVRKLPSQSAPRNARALRAD